MVIIVFVFLWVVETAEWGMAERQNGGMAEWWTGYIPNLPDIFTVHTDDISLIFYNIQADRACGTGFS